MSQRRGGWAALRTAGTHGSGRPAGTAWAAGAQQAADDAREREVAALVAAAQAEVLKGTGLTEDEVDRW